MPSSKVGGFEIHNDTNTVDDAIDGVDAGAEACEQRG